MNSAQRSKEYREKNPEKYAKYLKTQREKRKANSDFFKEYTKQRRKKNPEKIREQERTHYHKNREKYRENRYNRYAKNRVEINRKQSAWREANREKVQGYKREYYKRHADKVKAGHRRYYESLTLEERKNRTSKAAARVKRIRLSLVNLYGGRCGCCKEKRTQLLCFDHIHGGGSKHRKQTGNNMERMLKDIRAHFGKNKYRLLCYNCNMAYYFYSECSHKRRA